MERYTNYTQDRQGNAQTGVTVKAYKPFTGQTANPADEVQMYAVDGGSPINSAISDGEGRFDFYVNNARIDIRLVLGGVVVVLEDQLRFDPEEVGIAIDEPFDAQATRWHNGSGAPDDSLGDENDYYKDDDNGDYYTKTGGSWGAPIGNLQGPPGPPGLNYAGPYSASTSYAVNEWVNFSGSSYYAPVPIAAGTQPPNAPWVLLAAKGDDANGTITGDHALYEHKRVVVASDGDDTFPISPLSVDDERQAAVYRNGVRQIPDDYDFISPTTLFVASGYNEGDIIDLFLGTGVAGSGGSSHTHANKAVLDNLTQPVIDNSHTHANKAVLDQITAGTLAQLNTGIQTAEITTDAGGNGTFTFPAAFAADPVVTATVRKASGNPVTVNITSITPNAVSVHTEEFEDGLLGGVLGGLVLPSYTPAGADVEIIAIGTLA